MICFCCQKTSQEYKDACDLLELYEETRADLVEAVFGTGDKTERLPRKGSAAKEASEIVHDDASEEVCLRKMFSFQIVV